jgi:hypothetical protein
MASTPASVTSIARRVAERGDGDAKGPLVKPSVIDPVIDLSYRLGKQSLEAQFRLAGTVSSAL